MKHLKEYRKEITHDPDTTYAWVELGPIPGKPDWHQQSKRSSFPFPTNTAAALFATNNKAEYPDRQVALVHLDGHRVEIG